MKQIVCELCGSTDLVKQDGMYVCQFCNTKYTVEEARKLMVEGTVQIDRSDETQKLYIAARNARKASDYATALKHYEKISAQDPNSWEALFYLTILKTDSVKNGELASVALSIKACLSSVFQLLKENVSDEIERKAAVKEIAEQCNTTTATLITGSQTFYLSMAGIHGTTMVAGIGGMISSINGTANAAIDNKNRCKIMVSIMEECGDHIEAGFDMADTDYQAQAVWCWKQVLEFNDAFKKTNKSHISPEFIESCTTKIRKYEPDFGIITLPNASGDVGDRMLEIVFTAGKATGTQQELWVSVDDSETYKVWNGNSLQLQVSGERHAIKTHNPLMKKTYPINVPADGLRIEIHGASNSYTVSQTPLNHPVEAAVDNPNEAIPSQDSIAETPVVSQSVQPQNSNKSTTPIALILGCIGFLIPICAIVGFVMAIIDINKGDSKNNTSQIALIVSLCSVLLTVVLPLAIFIFMMIFALI